MRVKRYRLKEGATLDDLIKLGAREGGTWIQKECKYFLSKTVWIKKKGKDYINFEFSISIGFYEDIHKFDDFDNILILDEDFCQPYTPFYDHYNDPEILDPFPALMHCIEEYNKYMDSLPIFEEATNNG